MNEPTTIVIMTRAPRPGAAKTRLEPLLAVAGCARLQHALILHTATTARTAAPRSLHVAVDPPNAVADLRALLDPADTVFAQINGHLGARMAAAADRAYAARPGPVMVIGTDVPTLTSSRLLEARRLLDAGHDVVIGPALDGGYYLIALVRPAAEVFDIDPDLWGGPLVLAASIAAAEAAGLRVGLLPALRDLDTPEDAHALRADPGMPAAITALLDPAAVTPVTFPPRPRPPKPDPARPPPACGSHVPSVSIIVPALNEAPIIGAALARLRRDFPTCELLLVDGGSHDGTPGIAAQHARVLTSAAGRARQMNEGARHAHGEVLWFIHADTSIAAAALDQIRAALRDPDTVGGGLTLRFDRRSPALDYLARVSTLRARRLHHIFGDQALFVRRESFDCLGGFAPLPLMEDLEFSRRLHRCGRTVVLDATSTAASRRLTAHGTLRMIAFMQYLKVLYLAGVSPERIRRRYDAGPGLRLPTLTAPSTNENDPPAHQPCSFKGMSDAD